jgi:hypothetical protein
MIKNLNVKKASGPDKIENRLIRIIYNNNKNYMLDLFDLILKFGSLPKCWKIGKIIYFPKPNKKIISPADYRPITLLNNFCKIGEHLLIKRIDEKLNEISFYSQNQFGYRKNTSTINAINRLIKKIKVNRKKFKYNILLSLDMSNAFDSINWTKIIDNLMKSNLDHCLIMAVQSLLKKRKVYVDDKLYATEVGIPQGGKASASLWKIRFNDLLMKLDKLKNVFVIAYADVAVLIGSNFKNEVQRMTDEVQVNQVN